MLNQILGNFSDTILGNWSPVGCLQHFVKLLGPFQITQISIWSSICGMSQNKSNPFGHILTIPRTQRICWECPVVPDITGHPQRSCLHAAMGQSPFWSISGLSWIKIVVILEDGSMPWAYCQVLAIPEQFLHCGRTACAATEENHTNVWVGGACQGAYPHECQEPNVSQQNTTLQQVGQCCGCISCKLNHHASHLKSHPHTLYYCFTLNQCFYSMLTQLVALLSAPSHTRAVYFHSSAVQIGYCLWCMILKADRLLRDRRHFRQATEQANKQIQVIFVDAQRRAAPRAQQRDIHSIFMPPLKCQKYWWPRAEITLLVKMG